MSHPVPPAAPEPSGPVPRTVSAAALRIQIVRTATLSSADWDELWQLTDLFYETDRGHTHDSISRHQWIALVRAGGGGEILGTASISVHHVPFEGRTVSAIWTSHVLLRPEVRGRNLIQKMGLRMFLAERLRHPLRPIYWFFDTFSYKSYLLLPRNFREYWPRPDRPTPARDLALMDRLATRIYGADWRPSQGIVGRSGLKRLRATTAPLDAGRANSPDLEFFARANPGHAEGDMLVCLCPLTLPNWLRAARRAVARAFRRRPARARVRPA